MRRIFNILIILFILVIGASCNKKTIQVGLLLYSTNDKVVNDLTKELKKNIIRKVKTTPEWERTFINALLIRVS